MKRLGLKIALILLGLILLMLFAFNAYPTVTEEDRTYIKAFMKEWGIDADKDSIHSSFENEFAFVSRVQDSLLGTIKSVEKPNEEVGEIAYYFKHRKGICYDRAIMQEKIFQEYGFPIRHVYVYFNTDSTPTGISDFFRSGLNSHALLEIETVKGWMAVGTNHNWIGADSSMNPLTIVDVRAQLKKNTFSLMKQSDSGENFFTGLAYPWNFRYVFGIYSRHGHFLDSNPAEKIQKWLGIKTLMPDYNLRMLLYNF